MKEVKFAVMNDKLVGRSAGNVETREYAGKTINVYQGMLCSADEDPETCPYKEKYRVMRVSKAAGEDSISYSYLESVDKNCVGDIPNASYSCQGILYTNAKIMIGTVLRFMEGIDGSPATLSDDNSPSMILSDDVSHLL